MERSYECSFEHFIETKFEVLGIFIAFFKIFEKISNGKNSGEEKYLKDAIYYTFIEVFMNSLKIYLGLFTNLKN